MRLTRKWKEKFLKKRKSIEQKHSFIGPFYLLRLFHHCILLFILAFIPWIHRYLPAIELVEFQKGVRSYEPPQNLPPLLVLATGTIT